MQAYKPINSRFPFVWHGGDYNPEQWPKDIWDEDIRLMQESHFDIATVGVFSWVTLQPDEDVFRFEWLDEIIEKLHASGRFICLATPSAAQPAWMSQKYPDVLKADKDGARRRHGWRMNFCPTSPSYRRFAGQMASKLAERYHNHPALAVWHISNEYTGSSVCFCENCAVEFRVWLQKRYGSLENLKSELVDDILEPYFY